MNYVIVGKVIKGEQYGRKLGFPTVNLDTKAEGVPAGVYGGKVELEKKVYPAGIAVNNEGRADAYLVGYNGDAYGQPVKFVLEKFLREYKKFETEEELINQIKKDIAQI